MSIAQVVTVLQSAIFLALFFVLVLKLWPSLRLDTFRQHMFVVRDELFDYAASGKIGFNDPAYKLLRQSMNGFIRYAHQLTFFRLIFTLLQWKTLHRKPVFTWAAEWDAALKTITDETVKTELVSFHTRALTLVF